jgi:hypothetical protein
MKQQSVALILVTSAIRCGALETAIEVIEKMTDSKEKERLLCMLFHACILSKDEYLANRCINHLSDGSEKNSLQVCLFNEFFDESCYGPTILEEAKKIAPGPDRRTALKVALRAFERENDYVELAHLRKSLEIPAGVDEILKWIKLKFDHFNDAFSLIELLPRGKIKQINKLLAQQIKQGELKNSIKCATVLDRKLSASELEKILKVSIRAVEQKTVRECLELLKRDLRSKEELNMLNHWLKLERLYCIIDHLKLNTQSRNKNKKIVTYVEQLRDIAVKKGEINIYIEACNIIGSVIRTRDIYSIFNLKIGKKDHRSAFEIIKLLPNDDDGRINALRDIYSCAIEKGALLSAQNVAHFMIHGNEKT